MRVAGESISGFRQHRLLASLHMTPNDRVGLAEVAAMLGVTKNTALRYTRRRDFPAAVEQLASGRVWRHRDVEKWGKEHLPLPTGRPGQKRPPPAK
jgi:predicted DNA-binding transcriptional regulator AlpA